MKEPRKEDPDTESKLTPPPDKAAPAQPEAAKPAGLNYVFKFSKADPKNSFDFEDVADK